MAIETHGIRHVHLLAADRSSLDEAIAQVVAAGGKLVDRGDHAPGVPYADISDPDGCVIGI
ncbi:MAG TPA: hypothetical protein VNG12_26300 [Acidimicrobiales bacterium]|nr:hypothetical protein [Acidimicrobiales bacterium]